MSNNKNSRTPEQIKEDSNTRLRRAQIWMKKAEGLKLPQEDNTMCFIFWWIAFETLFVVHGDYAHKSKIKSIVHDMIYLEKKSKHQSRIAEALKEESGKSTMLNFVKLRATHPDFWKPPSSRYGSYDVWERQFNQEIRVIEKATNVQDVMKILFERLLIVRHQILHGASSHSESFGCSQVEWGADLLAVFIPIFIEIVEDNAETLSPKDWKEPPFPRVGKRDQEDIRPPWEKQTPTPTATNNQRSRRQLKRIRHQQNAA